MIPSLTSVEPGQLRRAQVPEEQVSAVDQTTHRSDTSARHASMTIPSEPCWVPAVRHFAIAVLRRWTVDADAIDSAAIVVSELAGNSAQYGRKHLTMQLSLVENCLRVHIREHGPRRAEPEIPHRNEIERGRGLSVVDMLATSCTVLHTSVGRETLVFLQADTNSC
ncbi:ATP-binding protein [Streptomyces sp. Tu102]|uniref:ATP-binding protein n=1 Tax=Streptomyces TaxID=1883 RepID=UPI001BDDA062|nr:ATP-binding protein [Streptomyces sp. Tu102]MBT1098064.1 ATP-binding protein [Streptomyces sp. Tu102]